MPDSLPPPSPVLLFETLNAYQRTSVLATALELGLFTIVGEGARDVASIAAGCQASERGTRILCDYLVVIGFLTKHEGEYGLTRDSAAFLDRRSPTYMGDTADFLLSPVLTRAFADLTPVVRTGATGLGGQGTVEDEHPVWVEFARAMAPMMRPQAEELVRAVPLPTGRRLRILDVAAGHGVFGIAFARAYREAEVTALDWPRVLDVARENAYLAGVENRVFLQPGSAFTEELGEGCDVVLLTNFLHHFDRESCTALLRRMHTALAPEGRAITLEFVPNPDRVSPPGSALFAMTMLATTASGDAYTFAEYEEMFAAAGFSRSELVHLQAGMEQVIVSYR